jgi:hypothetical protein
MAYVSDITNRFGVKETGSKEATEVPDSSLYNQTEDDPTLLYEPTETIDEDYGHVEADKSSLPNHLFQSAQASYDIEKYLLQLRAKQPLELPRAGVTKEPYFLPYRYIPITPEGFSQAQPDFGTIVKVPREYSVQKTDEHAWDCGCLHDL